MTLLKRFGILLSLALAPVSATAQETTRQISLFDQMQWDYFSDQIMGGVSEGRATFEQTENQPVLRLTEPSARKIEGALFRHVPN